MKRLGLFLLFPLLAYGGGVINPGGGGGGTTLTDSASLRAALSDELGTGAALFDGATPTGLTLTNATGLPVAGITGSTSSALGLGTIELGHASDTTIARVSAGVASIEGVTIDTISGANTLTNKTLTSPTLTTPALGTPASGDLSNCTNAPTLDPATTAFVRDEFWAGNTATGSIGDLGWEVNNSGAGTSSNYVNGTASHPGQFQIDCGQTQTSYKVLSGTSNQELLPSDTFDSLYIFQTQGDTMGNVTFRVGWSVTDNANPPTDGIYIEKLDSDTNWFYVTRAASTQTRADSGVAVAANTWYKFRIRRTDGTHIGFTINAGSEVTATANIPSSTALRRWAQSVHVAAAATNGRLNFDYFHCKVTGMSR